jgi:hypothetical protein
MPIALLHILTWQARYRSAARTVRAWGQACLYIASYPHLASLISICCSNCTSMGASMPIYSFTPYPHLASSISICCSNCTSMGASMPIYSFTPYPHLASLISICCSNCTSMGASMPIYSFTPYPHLASSISICCSNCTSMGASMPSLAPRLATSSRVSTTCFSFFCTDKTKF